MNTAYPGFFIAVDAPNKAGKTTLINQLSGFLSRSLPVVCSREPGGTPFGQELRRALLSNRASDFAIALAMNASRAENLNRVIIPALEAGKVVLTDRWSYSTDVFQCQMGFMSTEEIQVIDRIHGSLRTPDLLILLMPSIDLITKRLREAAKSPGNLDGFEGRPMYELEAYEVIAAREKMLGNRMAVLRYDEGTQGKVFDMLLDHPSFKELVDEMLGEFAS